jgi:membrane fusion protein (multidrug efflux system)
MEKQTRKWVSLASILTIAAAGSAWAYSRWRHNEVFVATDDAYVKGHVTAVAARIPGTLATLDVVENQPVQAGQQIASLDPKDFEAIEAKALAALAEARASMGLNQAQIAQAQAQIRAVESQKSLADLEERRLKALIERESIPRQKYDQAFTASQVAGAQVEAARKQVAALQGALGVSSSKAGQAQASLEQARLQRSYCRILAPCAGFVTRKLGEPGMVVAAGQPLLALVPLGQEDIWIEANFKETQLRNVHPGQKVRLRADIAEETELEGTVESIAAGTGSMFSLLPPENATGNWVKVVQRIPVRIKLAPGADPRHKLRLGYSVSAVIDTRS